MVNKWVRGEKAEGACIDSVYAATQSNTYPKAWYRGKSISHHRLIFCLANGIQPGAIAGMQVMHICDNTKCVNRNHLRLGTNQDNVTDKYDKGRENIAKGNKHYNAKLTADDVLAIRAATRVSQKDLALQYGVSRALICEIINRHTWKHI